MMGLLVFKGLIKYKKDEDGPVGWGLRRGVNLGKSIKKNRLKV